MRGMGGIFLRGYCPPAPRKKGTGATRNGTCTHEEHEGCYTTSTKTRVPGRVEPSGHCRNFGATLSYSNDGLGAARGQRFRKGPCASYPTHHYFPPHNTFLIF